MNHLSRLAEDLIIYSTAEFGYVSLADAYRYFYFYYYYYYYLYSFHSSPPARLLKNERVEEKTRSNSFNSKSKSKSLALEAA